MGEYALEMARRTGAVAKSIELMLLRPRVTTAECEVLCKAAKQAHVAAICVPPTHVLTASSALVESDVKLVALISHPFGSDRPSIKALAGRRALEDGAQELEIVVDLATFGSGNPNNVRDELARCIAEAREVRAEVMVRAVIETGVYDDRTLRPLVRAIVAADVDMVVTSSGLVPEPDDALDIELLREEVGAGVGIKAVRGVRGLDEVAALIAAGATRVGTANLDVLTDQLR